VENVVSRFIYRLFNDGTSGSYCVYDAKRHRLLETRIGRKYEGWNFNSGNYLFTTDTK